MHWRRHDYGGFVIDDQHPRQLDQPRYDGCSEHDAEFHDNDPSLHDILDGRCADLDDLASDIYYVVTNYIEPSDHRPERHRLWVAIRRVL